MSASEREPIQPQDRLFEPWHPSHMLAGDYDTPLRPDNAREFTIYARDPDASATEWITTNATDVITLEEVR